MLNRACHYLTFDLQVWLTKQTCNYKYWLSLKRDYCEEHLENFKKYLLQLYFMDVYTGGQQAFSTF